MSNKKEFLNLGRQPIANKFLKEDEFKDEFFFDLKVEGFDIYLEIGEYYSNEPQWKDVIV